MSQTAGLRTEEPGMTSESEGIIKHQVFKHTFVLCETDGCRKNARSEKLAYKTGLVFCCPAAKS